QAGRLPGIRPGGAGSRRLLTPLQRAASGLVRSGETSRSGATAGVGLAPRWTALRRGPALVEAALVPKGRRAPPRDHAAHADIEPPGEWPTGFDILVVDDDAANLLAIEAALGDLGTRLVKASSGQEALKRLLEQDF